MHIWQKITSIHYRRKKMNNNYRSMLPKEVLIYNIQYHLLKDCNTTEECIEHVKKILENYEAKDDREDK